MIKMSTVTSYTSQSAAELLTAFEEEIEHKVPLVLGYVFHWYTSSNRENDDISGTNLVQL